MYKYISRLLQGVERVRLSVANLPIFNLAYSKILPSKPFGASCHQILQSSVIPLCRWADCPYSRFKGATGIRLRLRNRCGSRVKAASSISRLLVKPSKTIDSDHFRSIRGGGYFKTAQNPPKYPPPRMELK